VSGMVLNYRTCMAAIDAIHEAFLDMAFSLREEIQDATHDAIRELDEHKKGFASRIQELHHLKNELSWYWKGYVGMSWALGLICMLSAIAAGVNGLVIHLFQSANPVPEDERVGWHSPLWLVCIGGGLLLITIKFLTNITNKCAAKGVKAQSIVWALEQYRIAWFENRDDVDPSWAAQLCGQQALLLNEQMGVNLLGLQYVDSAWLSSLVVRGCVAAPAAYTFFVTFLARHEVSFHSNSTNHS